MIEAVDILDSVREALGDEAAERIADKKKPEMAEAAEQLLAGTGWLPPILRTERPAGLAVDELPEALAMEDEALPETDSAETVEDEPFAVAAE